VFGFGVHLARRNIKRGRGDRRGAMRLAAVLFSCEVLSWAAGAHHVADLLVEIGAIWKATAGALAGAAVVGLIYLAVEPYARGRMPELLIGWARLLEGRFRDPRVGRDVLVGILTGSLAALCLHVTNALPTWIAITGQTTVPSGMDQVQGGRHLISALLTLPVGGLFLGMIMFGALLLLRLVLRRVGLATAALVVLITLAGLGGENVLLETPGALVMGLLSGIMTARFGLLAAITLSLSMGALANLPLPLSPVYASWTLSVVGLVLALAAYAFRISLGPGPIFGEALED
jgi:hypothetical protein